MNRADEFARDLKRELDRLTGEQWECGAAVGSGREAVDVCGKLGGVAVYIEVELRRDEPVTNVVKIWRAAATVPKGSILLRAFSSHYGPNPKNGRPNTHRANAVFIGGQMQKLTGIGYAPFGFHYKPAKGGKIGGDYRRRAARKLARKVLGKLKDFGVG
jgi:hypothetical protein